MLNSTPEPIQGTKERPFRTEFFIGNEYLGCGFQARDDRLQAIPRSIAYFCPLCGEIWARAVVQGSDRWSVSHSDCTRCGRWSLISVPGSLWHSWDPNLTQSFSEPVLRREWGLAAEFYQRYGPVTE